MFVGDMCKEKWFIEGIAPRKYTPLINVEIRKATFEDLDKFSKIAPGKRLKRFKDWYRKGYECFIALKDGEIIYYQWLAFSDFYHQGLNMNLKIQEDEVYPIDVYTLPEYRMKNLHLAVDSQLFEYCRDRKRYRLIATASPEQFPLFQIMYKRSGLGHVYPVKSITYIRTLWMKKHKIREFTVS